MIKSTSLTTFLLLSILITSTFSWESTYEEGHEIPVYVNKVYPYDNPSETYGYYTLAFC